MPELPEVEAARRLARRVALGRRIVGVWCACDPIVFERVPADRVRRALLGRRITGVGRHGKHFWLELDRRPWPAFHFGMAGGLHAPADRGVKLKAHGERGPGDGWPPRFAKLVLDLGGGRALAIADGRRLGRIRLREDPRAAPPISALGFDALDALPPAARFHALLTARAAPVKAVLLDQGFAAGIGNWIADEVLYQARVAPRRRASTLSRTETGRVRAAIRLVVGTAVRVGSDGDRFPKGWLFHCRWGKKAGACDARGRAIRHDQVGGRTTAWVPSLQR